MRNFALLLLLLLLVFFVPSVFASSSSSVNRALDDLESVLSGSSAQNSNNMRSTINDLVEENQRLKAQHDNLRQTWEELRAKVIPRKEEINFSEQTTITWEKDGQTAEELNDTINQLENEVLIKQSQNALLKSQLLDWDDRLRLNQLHFSDTDNELSQIQSELQLKELKASEFRHQSEAEFKSLRTAIEQSAQEEKEWQTKLAQAQQATATVPIQTQKLKIENAELEKKLNALQQDRDFNARELGLLKDKRLLAERYHELNVKDKQKERELLQRQITDLEAQQQALNSMMESFLSKQSEQRQLVNDVMAVDRENQNLRQNIAELEEKINGARP